MWIAALDFFAGPAAGARVVGVSGERGTGGAADGGVALVVERQERNVEVRAELPDIACGPVGERAELADRDAAGEGEVGDLFEGGAAAGLLAAKAGEPGFVTGDGTKEGTDLADAAAAIGLREIEGAELGFLLGDGGQGQEVGEVEVPVARDLVAVAIGLDEVVAGVEEEDGDVGAELHGELEEEDVFGLEGAGEAGVVRVRGGQLAGEEVADVGELRLELRAERGGVGTGLGGGSWVRPDGAMMGMS